MAEMIGRVIAPGESESECSQQKGSPVHPLSCAGGPTRKTALRDLGAPSFLAQIQVANFWHHEGLDCCRDLNKECTHRLGTY